MIRTMLLASAAAGAALLQAGVADAQVPFDWSGFYAGVHGGTIFADVSTHGGIPSEGGTANGLIGGGIAGYNFMRTPGAPYLLSLEADIGWTNLSNGYYPSIVLDQADGCANYFYDLNWDAHFRARVGHPVGNMMPFVAAGLALANLELSDGCRQTSGGVFVGGTVGAGLDFQLAHNLTGRAEVLYDFYGDKQYDYFSASLSAWTVRMALLFKLP